MKQKIAMIMVGAAAVFAGFVLAKERSVIKQAESAQAVGSATAPSKDAQIDLEPEEIFSSFASVVVDSDGFMHLTDNITAEAPSSADFITRCFKESIPRVWRKNVVIKTEYYNQTEEQDLYENPLIDVYCMRFYEKNTYDRYHSSHYTGQKNVDNHGILADLWVVNTDGNNLEKYTGNSMYIDIGTLANKDRTYRVFLNIPDESDQVEEDYKTPYEYLSDIDFSGKLISSFLAKDGWELTYSNSYIRSRYIDSFDVNGEGMKTEDIPVNYKRVNHQSKVPDEDVPSQFDLGVKTVIKSYDWTSFKSPWTVTDMVEQQEYQNAVKRRQEKERIAAVSKAESEEEASESGVTSSTTDTDAVTSEAETDLEEASSSSAESDTNNDANSTNSIPDVSSESTDENETSAESTLEIVIGE